MTIKQAAMWLCQPGIVSMIHDPTTKKALSVAVKALTESELSTNLASLGTDCISRQAAIDALERAKQNIHHNIERAIGDAVCGILDEVENGIKQLPPIQPKRGKWIHHPEIGWGETWLCDQCGEKTTSTVMGKPRANFCPNCGAKMEVNNESN